MPVQTRPPDSAKPRESGLGKRTKESATVATLRVFVASTAAVAPHSRVSAMKAQTPTHADAP
eukprot:410391-Prymnesium_polylepis.1